VLRAKFNEYGPLFIGFLVLLVEETKSNSASFGRFLEGDELRVGYGKENTLSGIASPGLVRLAPGYDSGNPG
jgi:hypothetical protein